ncbi:MAG TPA: lysine transporter LysE [Alphaproteobacteria bacterium]|nr:lysine transporter LysE [Alphaproteobacteria bacterium]
MTDPVQFILAVLTLLITPGPTNTVMATAGSGARRSPLPLLAAELFGYLAIIALARIALLPLIDLYPLAGIAIKLAVVAYLVYAAIRLWRGRVVLGTDGDLIGPRAVFLTTFLNPKGLIFAISVFPRESEQLWVYFILFTALVAACGFAWFSLGRGLASVAGARAALLPRVASIALLAFAALLATSLAR